MAAIRWLSVEPRTGRVVEELPGTLTTSTLPTMLGRDNTATVSLPISDRLPARWELATEPARAFLVACYDDPDDTVLWAGYVSSRKVGSGPTIDLQLTDINGYLKNTRRTLNGTFTQVDQVDIMAWLGGDIVDGMFHGDRVVIPSGVLRDRRYRDDEDKSRLDSMQQLMSVQGGCEWKFDYQWDTDGALVVVPTFAQSVGRRAAEGQPVPVMSDVDWTRSEDYGPGRGATLVTGVATREADERVTVKRQDDLLLDNGWLVLEHRWSPDTGSVDPDIIASYVDQKLADISRGTRTYSVSVDVAESNIIFGRDMGIGDDIEIDVRNPDLPGLDTTIPGRLIGWVAEPDPQSGEVVRIEPVLYQDDMEGV